MSVLLQDVSDPTLVVSGLAPSVHPVTAPLWIAGQNVVFEDLSVRKSPGYSAVCTTTGTNPVTGAVTVDSSGNLSVLWGDINTLYAFNNSVGFSTEGTGYSGTINRDAYQDNTFQGATTGGYEDAFQLDSSPQLSVWDMVAYGNWGVATNGINNVQYDKFDGNGAQALTTEVAFALCIVLFADQLLAFNTDLDNMGFEWSDIDNIVGNAAWIPTDTNAAGNLSVRDMGGPIIAAEHLGAYVGAYSKDALALVTSLGAPLYFGAQVVLRGIGACSRHSVVPVGYYNYGISEKGIWQTDGQSYNYISPPFLRKWIKDNVNFGFEDNIAGFYNEDRSLIEWGVPTFTGGGSGQNDTTIGFNVDNGSWTFKNYGITAGVQKGVFQFPIFGLPNGTMMFGEIGVDANGSAFPSYVQTKPFACITPKPDRNTMNYYKPSINLEWKIVESFYAHLQALAGTGVQVQIGVQPDLLTSITWSAPITPDGSSNPFFPTDGGSPPNELQGKYISFKISSSAIGDNWQLAGLQIFGSFNGTEI